jgi:hypothetical protein
MWMAVLLAVILGAHPPATTDLYADGVDFVEHVTAYWVVIHLLAAVILLALPLVLGAWATLARTAEAALFADLVAKLSIVGVAIGLLHLAGTDTVTFLAFQETLAANGEAATMGADVLLRLHAATLTIFALSLFFAVPLTAAIAAWLDGDRRWRFWLPLTGAALAAAAVTVTMIERQWTTLSEMVLFRSSATILLVWIFLVGWVLRRSAQSLAEDTA